MNKKYLCFGLGLDISKATFDACFGGKLSNGDFKVIRTKKFKNNPTGFEAFITWIEQNRVKNKLEKLDFKIMMEVTGVYHESVLYCLYRKGYQVCLELGSRVKHYCKAIGLESKNDNIDSKGMCQMAYTLNLKLWKPVSESILNIRSLLRHRKALLKTKTSLGNQLHANMISEVKDPEVANSLIKMIKQLKQEIKIIEARAKLLSKSDKEFHRKVMMVTKSVFGLGFISVLTVVSETNGFKEFRNRKQLESYAGLDIIENSSGVFSGKTRISKKGNANIRTVLYMSVLTIIRSKSKPYYDLYSRLMKRNGGISKKANVAVQRKLLLIIYTLWKKDEAFDLSHYESVKEVVPA